MSTKGVTVRVARFERQIQSRSLHYGSLSPNSIYFGPNVPGSFFAVTWSEV